MNYFDKAAILTIDMQNDFVKVGGAFHNLGFNTEPLMEIVNPLTRFLKIARIKSIPLFFIRSNYSSFYLSENIFLRYKRNNLELPFCIENTWGINLIDELEISKNDIIIDKYRYNAFLFSPLEIILQKINVSTLYFVGVETHVCLQQTAIHAYMSGYEIRIIEDCTASTNLSDKVYALNYCNNYYGTSINSKELFSELH